MKKVKVGISVGDLHGVGIEVIIKTFLNPKMLELCTPIVFVGNKTIALQKKILGITDFNFNTIQHLGQVNTNSVNVLDCWQDDVEIQFGQSSSKAGKFALLSLEKVSEALKNNEIDVLVTAPINKANVKENDSSFIGHTEFLGEKLQGNPMMIMLSEEMKIAFVTGHIPLSEVAKTITEEKVIEKIFQLNQSLIEDFAITKPKIAVIGLNPHAGEDGVLGREEKEIISPAIEKVRNKNILAFGPYPADSFFTAEHLKKFDGILAMYHDQGLTPFKTLSFSEGVNYTAGLSMVRTSPAHGTAYDIAGKNCADETSFRNAIYWACDILNNRQLFRKLTANPLNSQPQ